MRSKNRSHGLEEKIQTALSPFCWCWWQCTSHSILRWRTELPLLPCDKELSVGHDFVFDCNKEVGGSVPHVFRGTQRRDWLIITTSQRSRYIPAHPCSAWQHRCANNQCIDLHDHCDGNDDCGDGSDEENCCESGKNVLGVKLGTNLFYIQAVFLLPFCRFAPN